MSGVIFLILRVLLAAALYAFLGWSLHLIWRDLKQGGEVLAARLSPSIWLRVQDGDDLTTYQFNEMEISIGRDPGSECTLDSEKVSANHARLSFHHNQWWVEDLNSTNGSTLNNEPVLVPTVVADNDLLRCGDVLLTIFLKANTEDRSDPTG